MWLLQEPYFENHCDEVPGPLHGSGVRGGSDSVERRAGLGRSVTEEQPPTLKGG